MILLTFEVAAFAKLFIIVVVYISYPWFPIINNLIYFLFYLIARKLFDYYFSIFFSSAQLVVISSRPFSFSGPLSLTDDSLIFELVILLFSLFRIFKYFVPKDLRKCSCTFPSISLPMYEIIFEVDFRLRFLELSYFVSVFFCKKD